MLDTNFHFRTEASLPLPKRSARQKLTWLELDASRSQIDRADTGWMRPVRLLRARRCWNAVLPAYFEITLSIRPS